MDIVNLDGSGTKKQRRFRNRERRHTTDAQSSLGHQNFNREGSLSEECLSLEDDSQRQELATVFQDETMSSSSSWNSIFDVGDFESPSDSDYHYFESSQATSFQPVEMFDDSKHQYQLSYELALDNLLTPFIDHQPVLQSPVKIRHKASHIELVIHELRSTEKVYIDDLSQVVDGYQVPLASRVQILPVSQSDLHDLFGNISEIIAFHQSLVESLQEAGNSPKKIAMCFLSRADDFKIYTHYCNNYPKSVSTLTRLSHDHDVAIFLKRCQERLGHMLPLGAYLLKPVQRVLKYSLLLREMLKSICSNEPSYITLSDAIKKMTAVAEHINSMKQKYDAAVHVQEIQSLIRGNQEMDLTKFGELVLEDNFRYYGGKSSGSTLRGRTERYVFLFQQLFLITKKEEDGFLYKTHLEMRDIQLTERVEKDLNCFQIRQMSSGRFYTFQARSLEQKELWVYKIKLQLMDSVPELSSKAKETILKGFSSTSNSEPSSPNLINRRISSNTPEPKTSETNTQNSSSRKKLKKQSKGATLKLAQSTLTTLLSSSVYQDNGDSASQESDNGVFDNQLILVDSSKPPPRSGKHSSSVDSSPLMTSVTSPSNPIQLTKSSNHYSLDTLHHESEQNEGAGLQVSPSVEFEIVSTNFSLAQPVEIDIDQQNDMQDLANEHLFNELMSNDHDLPSVCSNEDDFSADLSDMSTKQVNFSSFDANTIGKDATVVGPVCSTLVHTCVVDNSSKDSDDEVTPKASPVVRRSASHHINPLSVVGSTNTFDRKVKYETRPFSLHRRYSFEENSERVGYIHRKQDSLSTDNTPRSSPQLQPRKKYFVSDHLQLQSPNSDQVGEPGLILESDQQIMNHSIGQLSPILPPPIEFAQNPSVENSVCSSLSSSYSKLTEMPPISILSHDFNASRSSYDLSPDELISINEVLANHSADTTGDVRIKSHNFRSPQLTSKRKKKRQRNLTIDAGTVEKLTHNNEFSITEKKSSTKVKKLAREYSQRIKNIERNQVSQEVSSELHSSLKDGKEPTWLHELKGKRKTKETQSSAGDRLTSEANPPERFHDPGESARKGLRGWVRSLVNKFSHK